MELNRYKTLKAQRCHFITDVKAYNFNKKTTEVIKKSPKNIGKS